MHIIRVQNPKALLDPNLQNFILGAVKEGPLAEVPPDALFSQILERAVTGPGSLFVALQGGEYRGVALTLPPVDPLDVEPKVVLYHTKKGSRKGTKLGLIQALVDFLKENHYTKAKVINPAGVRDSVFRRSWKKVGTSKKVASLMEVDLAQG